ncbi:unnamed protein product [Arabis nemorensis]|uniref:Uncharacterized protein n=1 Tax=Arabis nemorensis TaxID=586526 RepID=A0A565BKX9_9BRAS|nr:unnamed protein product [Arabis nemorensis]
MKGRAKTQICYKSKDLVRLKTQSCFVHRSVTKPRPWMMRSETARHSTMLEVCNKTWMIV